jgi:hypothetical protein
MGVTTSVICHMIGLRHVTTPIGYALPWLAMPCLAMPEARHGKAWPKPRAQGKGKRFLLDG